MFKQKLQSHWLNKLFLCVGLDSRFEQLPAHLQSLSAQAAIFRFNKAIIDATAEYVCAFKPNIAFYEASGVEGLTALKQTCDYLRENYPQILLILDAKRGDIDSTNEAYAQAVFDYFRADAVTVQPYLGSLAMSPFLERPEKGIIVLCRTSNPGAGELQDLEVGDGKRLYQKVAELAEQRWNYNDNVGLVVGATYPSELKTVRELAPTLPILVPGIGAQGGDLAAVLENGLTADQGGLIISASRSIIFASKGDDFAIAAATAARVLADEIKSLFPHL
jgi:orotidine-5'-phosphate decarboxylase